ncbi:MAG: nuclear transport factor 2 family protein [Candidatus Rokuibacteriota bacterium]
MSDVTNAVDTYLAMWNETDPTRRAAHIARAWTDDGHYADPARQASGREALSHMVAGVQARFPAHRFRRVSGIDIHHAQLRFGWELIAPDGAVVVAGLDVGELAPDGRLRRITGFFGDLPKDGATSQAAA